MRKTGYRLGVTGYRMVCLLLLLFPVTCSLSPLYAQGSTPTRFNLFGYNDLKQISTPSGNPNTGFIRVYAKTASTFCMKDYVGTETCFSAGGSGLTSLNGLTDATQTFATPGTTGTAPNWVSATGIHTLHIPLAATASVTAGLISKSEFDVFSAPPWSALSAAGGALSLANTSYATTFTQTSAVNWSWNNVTAATSSVNQSSPIFNLGGRVWHGGADTADNWAIQNVVTNGTDGASTLTLTHTGSTGAAALSVPGIIITGPGPWNDLTERANAITPATGHDICDQDSTAHGILCSFNNDTAAKIVRESAGSTNVNHVAHATAATGVVAYSPVVSADITDGTVAVVDVAAILKTRQFGFMLGADGGAVLTDADDQPTIFFNSLGQGITITNVWCDCDGGTPIIQLQKDDGSPANILTGNLTCASGSGASTTNFVSGENAIASTNRVDFVMVTAGGTAKRVTVSVAYTLD